MKKRVFLSMLLAVGMAAGSASASSYTYMFTASNIDGDMAADAKLVFDTSASTLSLTLTNDSNPLSATGSVLGGFSFTPSGVQGLALTGVSAAGVVVLTDPGIMSPDSTGTSPYGWTYSNGSLAAGSGSWKPYGIINDDLSYKDDGRWADGLASPTHNRYLQGPATFTFTYTGETGTYPWVGKVAFYFGTSGDKLPGTPNEGNPPPPTVPIPGSALLLGSGLAGLGLFGRRKNKA